MSKDEDSISKLFKNVNGFKVLKNYFKNGVLIFALLQILFQGKSKKSLEIVRNSVDNKILKRLRKRYKKEAVRISKEIAGSNLSYKKDDIIWICWFEGVENAPEIVQTCINSVKKNVKNRKIQVITSANYKNFVTFPEIISKKIETGVIFGAHLSDLIRLELLTKYGGTWIDATVYFSNNNYLSYFFDSDFFLFQKLKPALDGNPLTISNWFITSKANHPLLVMTKELLYVYWKKHNEIIHYFIFHLFFQISTEYYSEEWQKVIPTTSSTPHLLLTRLFDNYDEVIWNGIMQQTSIHKLTYKFSKNDIQQKHTFYRKIISTDQ